jgi:outer membrane protein TolC
MKLRAVGTLLSLATASLLAADQPWTIGNAVEAAMSDGTDAGALRERVEAARGLEEAARSTLWPRLDLRGSYAQTNGAMPGFGLILGQRTFDNTVDFNRPGRLDGATAAVDFSYRLYAGGADTAAIKAREASRAGAEKQLEADLDDLTLTVAKAFLDLRQASATKAALEASRTAVAASLKVAEAIEAEGRLLRAERLNLSVQLAQVEQQLAVAEALVNLSRRRFLILLGRPQEGTAELAPLAMDAAEAPLTPPAGSLRPELAAMRARVAAAAAAVDAAGAGHRPTLDLQATYQHDQGWLRNGAATSWSTGIVGRLNLFDGHETAGRQRAARAELRAAELALRRLEADLAFDHERARLGREHAAKRRQVGLLAVRQAEESAALTRERFQAGKALSAELITVEARLAEARLQLAIAESELISSDLAFRRAAGLPLLTR